MIVYIIEIVAHENENLHRMNLLTPLPSDCCNSTENLIIYSSGSIPILTKELNLKQTLLGGQAFR